MTGPIALKAAAGGKASKKQQNLEKASLGLYDPAPASGGSKAGAPRGAIAFQFNPKEVTIAKTAKWERTTAKGAKTASWKREPVAKAKKAPPAQFLGAGECKLTLEMFFDATSSQDGSVVEAVEQLFSLSLIHI